MARGDGTVYLRGQVWYVRYYRNGKPITIACPGLTEAQAKTKLRSEIRKGDDEVPTQTKLTVSALIDDLCDDYESKGRSDLAKHTRWMWKLHLQAHFGAVKAADFGTTAQRAYRTARVADGAAIGTTNRELQILRRAFKVAAEQEPAKVKRVPKFLIIKEDNARQGFVTPKQMEAVRVAASNMGVEFRAVVDLAYWLGWRRGEVLNLKVRNIRLDDAQYGVARLEGFETKNGKPREVPLTKALRSFLEPLVVGRGNDDRLFKAKMSPKAWRKIRKEAGFPELLFHDLRRSSARNKRTAGVSEGVIMEMQGWQTDSMFRRYAIVSHDDKAKALEQQEAYEAQLVGSVTTT